VGRGERDLSTCSHFFTQPRDFIAFQDIHSWFPAEQRGIRAMHFLILNSHQWRKCAGKIAMGYGNSTTWLSARYDASEAT